MASIRTSAAISIIRGSVGGNVFSQNANGAYMRNRTKASNPNTELQRTQRNSFGGISRLWSTLTAEQQGSFVSQAPNYPYINRLGESSIYTGFQLFVQSNNRLKGIGRNPLLSMPAPITISAIEAFEIDAATVVPSVLEITVNFPGGSSGVPDGVSMVVWATRFMSAGVYRPKQPDFKKAKVLLNNDPTQPYNAYDDVTAISGVPLAGHIQYVQIQLVSITNGQVGASIWNKIVWS